MKTKLFPLKVFLLTIILKKSVCLVFSERVGVPWNWNALWKKMNTIDNDYNLKSSCPWEYVNDSAGELTSQLLSINAINGKWRKPHCIDLNQSNATHLIPNPRGQCNPIKACGIRVGYTCIYDVTIRTNKRNEGVGPLVNGGSRDIYTTRKPFTEHISRSVDGSIFDRKTSTKSPFTNSENNEGNLRNERTVKYPAVLHQNGAPHFLGNAQFKYPSFLQNNYAQFRPGFLHGMNVQMGQHQMMPLFAHAQRNLEYEGKETPEEITEYVDGDSKREFLDVEDTQDPQPTDQDAKESTVTVDGFH